jgi:hypothetical protein
MLWAMNGCDTFAYVDRTLADRRAAINADDPSGTKYMDQITNVMAGTFDAGPSFTMTLVDAAVGGTRSYRDILGDLDPAQIAVVTGDEDNTFVPHAAPPVSGEPVVTTTGGTPAEIAPAEDASPQATPPRAGCAMGAALPSSSHTTAGLAVAFAALALGRQRRSRRWHFSRARAMTSVRGACVPASTLPG